MSDLAAENRLVVEQPHDIFYYFYEKDLPDYANCAKLVFADLKFLVKEDTPTRHRSYLNLHSMEGSPVCEVILNGRLDSGTMKIPEETRALMELVYKYTDAVDLHQISRPGRVQRKVEGRYHGVPIGFTEIYIPAGHQTMMMWTAKKLIVPGEFDESDYLQKHPHSTFRGEADFLVEDVERVIEQVGMTTRKTTPRHERIGRVGLKAVEALFPEQS